MSDTKLSHYRVVVAWTESEVYEVQAEDALAAEEVPF